MQKKKGQFNHADTFVCPQPKYINDNGCYEKMGVGHGGKTVHGELILEQKEIILEPHSELDILQPKSFKIKPNDRIFPIDKIKDGFIIKLFDKTPLPQNPTDVVCPHFYELKWANGCNFNCAWCYLNGTYRFLSRGKKPHLKDINIILSHLDLFLKNVTSRRFLLNSGELSDSLLFENDGAPMTKKIIPKVMEQNRHKLLLLTKSNQVHNLLKINAQEHIIASFSLNSFEVSQKWEKGTKVIDRIEAAKKLYNSGYTVRVRIDPMVPIKGWEKSYKDLVDNIFDTLIPERITLGSLRGLQSTINNCKDTSWTKYLTETSNWGKKVDTTKRYKMYFSIINYLHDEYNYKNVALCKETIDMWHKLNLDYKKIKCNCML